MLKTAQTKAKTRKMTRKIKVKSVRKSKFQADLPAVEDNAVRALKQELQLTSNSDFLSEAVALFKWAVNERRLGHRILSESVTGEKKILLLPRLERVAPPEINLPVVNIDWTKEQLEHLAKMAQSEAPKPTEALVRLMKG